MFIAHMPAGFLLTRYCLRSFGSKNLNTGALKNYMLFGLICSVLPDFDLIYFYLIDNRQHAHHSYWTHIPLFWLLLSGLLYFGTKAVFKRKLGLACVILLVNTQLHLFLDSVAGGVYWLYPLNREYYRLFNVSVQFDWWVFNFIFHWSFMFEVIIVVAAIYVVWRDRQLVPERAVTQYDS
ncbi:metal-dependent hydrolase [Kaarinaea lacus]